MIAALVTTACILPQALIPVLAAVLVSTFGAPLGRASCRCPRGRLWPASPPHVLRLGTGMLSAAEDLARQRRGEHRRTRQQSIWTRRTFPPCRRAPTAQGLGRTLVAL